MAALEWTFEQIETALHTEGTTQVSERFNVSDIAKKLYTGESNCGIADNDQIARDSKLRLIFTVIRKAKAEEAKVKTHTKFKGRVSVIQD